MYFCKGEKESNCLDIKNLTTIVSMNNVKNLTTCLQKEKDFRILLLYSLEKKRVKTCLLVSPAVAIMDVAKIFIASINLNRCG